MSSSTLPSINDPRWMILFFIGGCAGFLIYQTPAYGNTLGMLFLCLLSAGVTDFIISKAVFNRVQFPLSAITTATGIVLILFSVKWWVFVLAPIIAVLSKQVFRYNRVHIFNPNNFAFVVLLVMFGEDVSTTVGRWGAPSYLIYVIAIVGLVVARKARRELVSLSWVFGFFLFAAIRAFWEGSPIGQNLIFITSPLFFVFAFYHITDPITSPQNYRGQICFGLLISLVDSLLRSLLVLHSPFIALFIVTAVQPLFPLLFIRDYDRLVWKSVR